MATSAIKSVSKWQICDQKDLVADDHHKGISLACENKKAKPMALAMNISTLNLNFPNKKTLPCNNSTRVCTKPLNCIPSQQQVEVGVECEPCSGKGWLLCEFCKGQKTNVRAENSQRIYRRCPSCRAIGMVLCTKCRVYKCVTFPDHSDGEELKF